MVVDLKEESEKIIAHRSKGYATYVRFLRIVCDRFVLVTSQDVIISSDVAAKIYF